MILMSDKTDENMIEYLNETIQKKDPKEPMEKTLVTFCSKQAYRSRTPESTIRNLKKGHVKEKIVLSYNLYLK